MQDPQQSRFRPPANETLRIRCGDVHAVVPHLEHDLLPRPDIDGTAEGPDAMHVAGPLPHPLQLGEQGSEQFQLARVLDLPIGAGGLDFSEEQIVGIVKAAEAGTKVTELCRQHGITRQTLRRWRERFHGMSVREARELKRLEDENRRLKRAVAELTLDNQMLRDVASRNAKLVTDAGLGVGDSGLAVYLDFRDAIKRDSQEVIKARYGNLFDMYRNITDENPYETPMRIFPAVHYTMGGLWVDYNLMSNIPGLFVAGEANFSDHGANRLGASALMQGLSDGYFIIPYTIGNYLAGENLPKVSADHEAFKEAAERSSKQLDRLLAVKGDKTIIEFHRELGKIMWDKCGMARNEQGLKEAIEEIRQLKKDFWSDVRIPGGILEVNNELDKANRVADFIELGELMCIDALHRRESCGGHFREEMQTEEGEALRDDENFQYAAAWEYKGEGSWEMHKEELNFEVAKPTQRSYK